MKQIRAIALILPLALAACAAPPPPQGAVDRLRPQLAEAVHSYRFNECSGSIPEAEQTRIRHFLGSLWLTPQDVIVVSLPKGRNATRDVQRRRTMTALLTGTPAQLRFVADRDFRDDCRSESVGMLRVVRVLEVGTSCHARETTGGCASARNLAAMMAEPSDSFLPRPGGGLRGSGVVGAP
ncbi:CpaD family pilus assembly lipoprotein [Pseudooceanicola aestuarii]|uniref:CpaD family pilus assembly lipoprotein n=1 Tax=Pseudooceanicola aestuarii TaxID=2697319 RepID=UPI0013D7916F|nr:CpaD family pilus assembly lipoprotein [Pseudooceanicola aestuarii]